MATKTGTTKSATTRTSAKKPRATQRATTSAAKKSGATRPLKKPSSTTKKSSAATKGAAFEGFPLEGVRLLRALEQENSKAFFDAHRAHYDDGLLTPGKAFVDAIGPRLQKKISSGIRAEPRVGGSIFRINRDTRFSADKRPYKTHFDFWFWEGDEKNRSGDTWGAPGLFLRLTGKEIVIGAGMHAFPKETLHAFRDAVVDDRFGRRLDMVMKDVQAKGFIVGDTHYKRVPRGFDDAHPRADLLKYASLHASLTRPHPKELTTPSFVDVIAAHFEAVAPIQQWLRDVIASRIA